jgi:hypothetical protein
MVCSCQMGRQSYMIGAAPSHHTAMDGGAFFGDAKTPGMDI